MYTSLHIIGQLRLNDKIQTKKNNDNDYDQIQNILQLFYAKIYRNICMQMAMILIFVGFLWFWYVC